MAKTIGKGFEYDKNFKPLVPTLVLTATVGPQTVLTRLYGPVSPEREARERREVRHRAEQLAPLPPRVVRERPFPSRFERILDEFEAFDR